MKLLLTALITLIVTGISAQQSEELIPKEAISVFSVNNINLLQKISLDDLVQYEFMEEIQQEIFDGSTSGKTLKDSGIDFDQKLNIFIGKGENFEVRGITFGVSDRNQLFQAFDDYQPVASEYSGIDMYVSYFNRIAIQGTSGILFRVTPYERLVNSITDSIWYARGNDYPWYDYEFFEEDFPEEGLKEEIEFFEEMETEENTETPIEDNLPIADDDPNEKTYYELRDSVELALQQEYLKSFCKELFIDKDNLIRNSEAFRNKLTSDSEGIFYMDNSKNLTGDSEFSVMKMLYPRFFQNLQELYTGNIMLGDLHIEDNSIELELDARYGEQLGSIYKELTATKMNKNMLKYIHKDDGSFFTYNVDMRKAYEQAYDIMIPLMKDSDNPMLSSAVLMYELMDEFLNKDAIFDTYKGGMFGTYSGIEKIKTTKIIFDYDEETFEYIEKEVEAEEDMPIFTLGFATERNDIAEKVLRHLERLSTGERRGPNVHNLGGCWVAENAVLNSAPLYIINKNGLLIFTNDELLAKQYSDGYGKEAMSKKRFKKAKKGGAIYAFADLGKAVEDVPKELFNDRENEMIDVLRGKSGTVELSSSKTSSTGTTFKLSYKYEGSYENSGTYILDLINSLYVISK